MQHAALMSDLCLASVKLSCSTSQLQSEWWHHPHSKLVFLHSVARALAEERLDFLFTLCGTKELLINWDNKYNNFC